MTRVPQEGQWDLLEDCGPFARHAAAIYIARDAHLKDGKARFGFRVEPHHCNLRPHCHGGMLATFLDVALARGLRVLAQVEPPLPTISMSVDFMSPAPLESWVEAFVSLDRLGASTGFVSAYVHADGALVMRGSGVFRHFTKKRAEA